MVNETNTNKSPCERAATLPRCICWYRSAMLPISTLGARAAGTTGKLGAGAFCSSFAVGNFGTGALRISASVGKIGCAAKECAVHQSAAKVSALIERDTAIVLSENLVDEVLAFVRELAPGAP